MGRRQRAYYVARVAQLCALASVEFAIISFHLDTTVFLSPALLNQQRHLCSSSRWRSCGRQEFPCSACRNCVHSFLKPDFAPKRGPRSGFNMQAARLPRVQVRLGLAVASDLSRRHLSDRTLFARAQARFEQIGARFNTSPSPSYLCSFERSTCATSNGRMAHQDCRSELRARMLLLAGRRSPAASMGQARASSIRSQERNVTYGQHCPDAPAAMPLPLAAAATVASPPCCLARAIGSCAAPHCAQPLMFTGFMRQSSQRWTMW